MMEFPGRLMTLGVVFLFLYGRCEVQLCTEFRWGLLTAVYRVELITEGLEQVHLFPQIVELCNFCMRSGCGIWCVSDRPCCGCDDFDIACVCPIALVVVQFGS